MNDWNLWDFVFPMKILYSWNYKHYIHDSKLSEHLNNKKKIYKRIFI